MNDNELNHLHCLHMPGFILFVAPASCSLQFQTVRKKASVIIFYRRADADIQLCKPSQVSQEGPQSIVNDYHEYSCFQVDPGLYRLRLDKRSKIFVTCHVLTFRIQACVLRTLYLQISHIVHLVRHDKPAAWTDGTYH